MKNFIYQSFLDSSGSHDAYVYLDTLFPEKERHPYTRDACVGAVLSLPSRYCQNPGCANTGNIIVAEPYSFCTTCGRPGVPNGDDDHFAYFSTDVGVRLAAMDLSPQVV